MRFKTFVVPAVSALVGGAAVVAALKVSPDLRSRLESTQNKSLTDRDLIFDDIIKQENDIRKQFDSIFDGEVFGHKDPFEEMKKMRRQMEKRMEQFDEHSQALSNPFDSWFSGKFGGGSINDITKREDDSYVYYDIKVDDVNSTSIDTKIENGYITITGNQEKKSESKNDNSDDGLSSQSYFKSTFNRTFPLPEHIDANKMEMIPEKDKVILKFPKLKS